MRTRVVALLLGVAAGVVSCGDQTVGVPEGSPSLAEKYAIARFELSRCRTENRLLQKRLDDLTAKCEARFQPPLLEDAVSCAFFCLPESLQSCFVNCLYPDKELSQ